MGPLEHQVSSFEGAVDHLCVLTCPYSSFGGLASDLGLIPYFIYGVQVSSSSLICVFWDEICHP